MADIDRDTQAAEVVQTILALARILDMQVVAEGVENENQALLLAAMGCTKGQGFLFGRPMPHDDLMRRIAGERAAADAGEIRTATLAPSRRRA
jgi:EAL domain-containing protein (putative c-di-GMP-specific phosphodiesterase class I)